MHPTNRAERRHHRERVISARKSIYKLIWRRSSYDINCYHNPLYGNKSVYQDPEWGRYAKWNLGCGCKMCHAEKYFKYKRKRRETLKKADRDWENDLEINT